MAATSASVRAAAVIILAALSGCTAADCDPSRADLFSGIGCAASGSYAARESQLRSGVAAAQANELERQSEASRAAADAANAQQDLVHKRQQLAAVDRQLNTLRLRLDAARQRQGVDQEALRRAQAELDALRTQRAQVSPQSNDADLRALDAPMRELGDRLNRDGLQ
jgi:chromosome segregation protein